MPNLAIPIALSAITAAASTVSIGSETHVTLGTVCAVGAVVFAGTWWLAQFMKGITDQLAALQTAVDKMGEEVKKQKERCKGLCDRYTFDTRTLHD